MIDLLEKLLEDKEFKDIFQPASDEELSKVGLPHVRYVIDKFYTVFSEPANFERLSKFMASRLSDPDWGGMGDEDIDRIIQDWQDNPSVFKSNVLHQMELSLDR